MKTHIGMFVLKFEKQDLKLSYFNLFLKMARKEDFFFELSLHSVSQKI